MPAFTNKDAVDLAQTGFIRATIGKLFRPCVTVQTGPANDVAAAVAIQGRVHSDGSWITLSYTKPDGTLAASLVGVDKIGTVDSSILGACTEVQAVRTDAAGGVCQVYLGITTAS